MKKETKNSIKPESSPPPPDLKAAIEELRRGLESTNRLKILLQEALLSSDSATRVLVEEALGSFERAIRALDSTEKPEAHLVPATTDGRRSGHSDGKRSIAPARRGGYRRRANPYSWKTITSKTMTDGHTWRKYGQKEIYSSNFPRSYFRCTHKHDQGCQATRQVQRSEEDPAVFVITYMGEHTCGDLAKGMDSLHGSPYLISFGSNATTAGDRGQQPLPPPAIASFFPSPLKQESDEEVLSNLNPGSSSSEYPLLLPPELGAFEGSSHLESGYSCSSSLEIDFMADSFQFDDVFNFDDEEFLGD